MENFDLIPGIIFDEEFEACKSRGNQNSPKERELIRKMADRIEHFILSEYQGRLSEIGSERVHDGRDWDNWEKMDDNFDNNTGPHPLFFITGSRVIEYHLCYKPVSFGDKNDFGLFLFFQLKNCTLHDIEDWLNALLSKHGIPFLSFLDTHLDEYKEFYQDKWFNFISKWLDKVKEGIKEKENMGSVKDTNKPVDSAEKDGTQVEETSQKLGLTNAQLALLFYFFFKHVGLEIRSGIDIAPVAKLVHLLSNKPISKLPNSDIYKMLGKVPSIHQSPERNISDMEVVKSRFKDFSFNEIEKEINDTIKREISVKKK